MLPIHVNMNDSHISLKAHVCVKAFNIWHNNSTGAVTVVNIIRLTPCILGARLQDRDKVILHVNQNAASVSHRQHLSVSYERHPSFVECLYVCVCV